jgi:hypothetical protein
MSYCCDNGRLSEQYSEVRVIVFGLVPPSPMCIDATLHVHSTRCGHVVPPRLHWLHARLARFVSGRLGDCRRMPRERRYCDLHKGKQGQAEEDGVQLIVALHVEDADIGV